MLAVLTPLASSESGGSSFLVSPNLGLMIWTLLAFGVTLIVLNKFAFPAIRDALDKRVKMIDDSIEDAKKAREESDALLAEYRERLKDARVQADEIVARARKAAETHEHDSSEEARAKRAEMLEQTRRDIDAELLKEQGAHLRVRLPAPLGGRRRRLLRAALELGGQTVNFLQTFVGQLVMQAPRRQRVALREQLLHFPVAFQRRGDLGHALLAAVVAVRGEVLRVAFARDDRIENGQPRRARDVGDRAMQQYVHLIEGLLQAQQVRAGPLHQTVAMPQQRADGTDLERRPERSVE